MFVSSRCRHRWNLEYTGSAEHAPDFRDLCDTLRHVVVAFPTLQNHPVSKRLDSRYEAGQRSGARQKMRLNRGQEFVIGGYTLVARGFDAVIFGYFESDRLLYAGRTRSGFTPASREKLWRLFRGLEIAECPFVNFARGALWPLGAKGSRRRRCANAGGFIPSWSGSSSVEWTLDGHLRHVKFISLRGDKGCARSTAGIGA